MDGQAIKTWRVGHALTQEQLAALIGVNVWTVAAWEQSRQRPPSRLLELALRELEREMEPEGMRDEAAAQAQSGTQAAGVDN